MGIILGLSAALGVEAALLGLAHWQYGRWQQRLAEQAAARQAPTVVLTGRWLAATAALDNQPDPRGGPAVGWRLLQAADVSENAEPAVLVIDRGWWVPENRHVFDAATYRASGTFSLPGVWAAAPPPRGWLRGPTTTTAPNILALVSPTAVHPAALPQRYFVATEATAPGQLYASRLPTRAPERHVSYMLQWLGLAVVFPVLCAAWWRHNRRRAR